MRPNLISPNCYGGIGARYLVWLPIFYIAAHAYRMVPYYNLEAMQPALFFFDMMLKLYLVGGLPYLLFTLAIKSSRVEDFYDPAVRIILMIKQTLYRVFLRKDRLSLTNVFKKHYNRKVLLNLVIRAYFIPIMVSQVYILLNPSILSTANHFNDFNLLAMLFWLSAILWLCDVINASVRHRVALAGKSHALHRHERHWLGGLPALLLPPEQHH